MKKIIHNNMFVLKIFFCAVPVYATCNIFFIVMRSLLLNTVGNVLFIQYLVKSVEHVLVNAEETHKILIQLIIVTCIYYGLVLIFNTVIEGMINNKFCKSAEIKVRKVFTNMMFEKSSKIDLSYYDNQEYYNNLVVANNESTARAWSTYKNFVNLVENFTVMISLFYIISSLDIVVLGLAILINVLSSIYQFKMNKVNEEVYNKTVPYNKEINYVNRIFFLKQNSKDLKTSNASKILFHKLSDSSKKLTEINEQYGLKRTILCFGDNLIKKIAGEFATLLYLAYMVLEKGVYSFDVMTALWNAYNTIRGNINNFVNSIKELHNNSIYIEKFIHFMEIENCITSDKQLKINENKSLTIEFVNVSFSYDKETNILDKLNLKININEKVAIVGSNGAGKSTLTKLLLRLYEPDEGKILVNGTDIRDYDIDFYRKNICSVLGQNFQLFALTLYENVKMNLVDHDADDEELAKVLDMVGLNDKIQQLEKKGDADYSREFNSHGVIFSGGQKQKLALARVLLNNKKLVILDEPSSALDPKAESEFNELVFNMLPKRTVILISHRLSTTKMADRIILIENGKVAEDGSHDTLMKMNRTYAKMFQMQSRRYR